MIRRISVVVICLVVLGLLTWDIAAYVIAGTSGTISDVLLSWALHKPILAFAFGFLMGHLFWPQYVIANEHED